MEGRRPHGLPLLAGPGGTSSGPGARCCVPAPMQGLPSPEYSFLASSWPGGGAEQKGLPYHLRSLPALCSGGGGGKEDLGKEGLPNSGVLGGDQINRRLRFLLPGT